MSAEAPALATPAEIRAARSYLRRHVKAGSLDIPPRHFANAAKELGVGYTRLLALLGRMYAQGQSADTYLQQAVEAAAGVHQ